MPASQQQDCSAHRKNLRTWQKPWCEVSKFERYVGHGIRVDQSHHETRRARSLHGAEIANWRGRRKQAQVNIVIKNAFGENGHPAN